MSETESVADQALESYGSREEWLAARAKSLGSSDAPVILGVGHQADSGSAKSLYELWAEKTGKLDPSSEPDSPRLRMGHILERAVRDEFAGALPGLNPACVHAPREFTIYRRAYLHATPDYLVWPENSPGAPVGALEVKSVEGFAASDWADGPSSYAMIQAHHQAYVGGWSQAWVWGWIGFGRVDVYHVALDRDLMDHILNEEERFWRLHVLADVPPAVDESDSTRRTLAKLHPKDNGEVLRLGMNLADVAARLQSAKALRKDAEASEQHAENELKAAIGDASEVEILDAFGKVVDRYSWRWQERKGYTVEPTSFRQLRRLKVR